MKAYITFLGCKVNQYETELIIEQLERAGFVVSPQPIDVDVCIVNTCMVTAEAERQSRQVLRKLKRLNPKAVVVVTGCYPHLNPQLLVSCGADLVLGNTEKMNLVEHINNWFKKKEALILVSEPNYRVDQRVRNFLAERVRAYVKVEDGCNEYCTYCIVPVARGRSIRSKDKESVLQEVKNLVVSGYKEIVLTGVNLGKYGKDINTSLAELIQYILDKVNDNFRIRLSSINVQDVSNELVSLFKYRDKLCPHLHIPMQSGSNRVLKLMNRKYTVEQALSLFGHLRSLDPDFSITTDIIVGFPGETIGDFEKTLTLLAEAKFTRVHAFKYSERPGTPASRMTQKVPPEEKNKRMKLLKELAERIAMEYRNASVGKVRTVLVEASKNGVSYGYDEYYVRHELVSMNPGDLARVVVRKPNGAGVVSQVVNLEKNMVQ